MTSLEAEYTSIVAQLDAFLESADLASAVKCITSKNLEDKIKEIDRNWLGLRELPAVTLQRLKAVVTTIRQGIFCGEGHLFYIVVRSNDKEKGSDCVYPTTRRDKAFEYSIHDEDLYWVDIKDLSGNTYTTNLYAYDENGKAENFYNPFNLTQPRQLEMRKKVDGTSHDKFLPYGLRLYGFSLDEEDRQDVAILKNDTNGTVLTLKFDYAQVDARHDIGFLLNELNIHGKGY